MVLNLNNMMIDMDKVSAVIPSSKYIVIDGTKVTILKDEYMDAVIRAFIYTHKSYMCDDKLKKISWVRREAV
jgi:hypothetical protein